MQPSLDEQFAVFQDKKFSDKQTYSLADIHRMGIDNLPLRAVEVFGQDDDGNLHYAVQVVEAVGGEGLKYGRLWKQAGADSASIDRAVRWGEVACVETRYFKSLDHHYRAYVAEIEWNRLVESFLARRTDEDRERVAAVDSGTIAANKQLKKLGYTFSPTTAARLPIRRVSLLRPPLLAKVIKAKPSDRPVLLDKVFYECLGEYERRLLVVQAVVKTVAAAQAD